MVSLSWIICVLFVISVLTRQPVGTAGSLLSSLSRWFRSASRVGPQ